MAASPLRIAHRGMPRRARENTLPSFAAALEAGANGVELDVHATSDGVVVVHHDPSLPGGPEIARTRWPELRSASAAMSLEIPTLAEVCELVADRVELFVEIKGAGIEEEVLHVLARQDGRHAIHSFDHQAIARLARRVDPPRLGVLFDARVLDVGALLSSCGAQDAWPHHSLVDAALVAAVRGARGRIIAWTVNAPRDIARLTSLGVDGICTDDVTLVGAT